MKRFTGIILVLAMLLTFVPLNVFAVGNDDLVFKDVKASDYYAQAVIILEELGIVSGYPDGTYRAEKTITRAEMATIVCRIIDKEELAKNAKGETIFDDVASDHWASGYINVATNYGIISGDGDGKFRPEDDVKFEESVKMVVCALGYADEVEVDPDDWSRAYFEIADDKGITTDLHGNKGEAATRGDIAVMSYNGMMTASQSSESPAIPIASLKAGVYRGTQEVELSSLTDGATIYYTTDGTMPTVESTKYEKAISVKKTCTIKAIAVKDGIVSNDVLSVDYTIRKAISGGSIINSSRPTVSTYTVSFDLNYEGAVGAPMSQSVKSGYKVKEPTTPVREGYSFAGWYKDSATTKAYAFSQSVRDDMILYAKWIGSDSATFTRAKWINLLLTYIDAEVESSDSRTNYYSDTQGHEYEDDIEAAKAYGIIPADEDVQDVPVFDPDAPADREFAAITAVLAMGFVQNGSSIECEDVDELEYPVLARIAVSEGFIVLENDRFYPDRALNAAEKEQIFDTIDQIVVSSEISEEIEELVYSENVLTEEFEQVQTYEVTVISEGLYSIKMPIDDENRIIAENDYFVLPANDDYPVGMALKAIEVQNQGEYLIIKASTPEDISKVMSKVLFSGKATPLADNIELTDDNVSYTYNPNGVMSGEDAISTYARFDGRMEVPGFWTFDFDGFEMGNLKLTGQTKVTIPDVSAYVDADFAWLLFDVHELTFTITERAEITGALEYVVADSSSELSVSGAKEFARVPFALGATGLSVDLVFSLYYDVSGSVSITYTIEATQGFQYKNGDFRFIHDFDTGLDIPEIEAKAEAGLQIALNLTFFEIWDLAGISGRVGAVVTVSVNNHPDIDLCCLDATLYLSAKIGLNRDTLLGEFLEDRHYTLEIELYNSENSPLKSSFHMENFVKVPECTYGDGMINGFVYDASTREPLRAARVCVYQGDDLKAIRYTNATGKYEISSGLPVGAVTIKISATGYQTYSANCQINRNSQTYIETYMMVSRLDEGNGNVSGRFIDALTGSTVNDVTYEVRDGWNNTTGAIIESETVDGEYSFDIVAGNYTILAKADDYIAGTANIAVTGNSFAKKDIILSPEGGVSEGAGGNMRFVLTWGEYPRDLDSHMFGPTVDGEDVFHTFFREKNYYEENELIANLDLDDTTSYGPETTTVYTPNAAGTYSFYVHDYTNKDSDDSRSMSNSSAKVVIYNGNSLFATFHVPTDVGGTVWHVFDYDAATGIITPVNTMSYSSNVSDLGRNDISVVSITDEAVMEDFSDEVYDNDLLSEVEAILAIAQSSEANKE